MKRVNLEIEKLKYGTREQIKALRTNIQFCGDDKQVIMLTSCVPGEGKSFVSLCLAKAIAEMGKTVVLIDADMRKSVLASRIKGDASIKGLSHFLSGQCVLGEAIAATDIPKLHLMAAGPSAPNPTELLEMKRFHALILAMRKAYDYVIIDCPPLGLVIDAAIIAREADGAILVVEAGKTKYRLTQVVKERLENTGIPIMGGVLNKVEHTRSKGYYTKYYGSHEYGEYYGREADKEE